VSSLSLSSFSFEDIATTEVDAVEALYGGLADHCATWSTSRSTPGRRSPVRRAVSDRWTDRRLLASPLTS